MQGCTSSNSPSQYSTLKGRDHSGSITSHTKPVCPHCSFGPPSLLSTVQALPWGPTASKPNYTRTGGSWQLSFSPTILEFPKLHSAFSCQVQAFAPCLLISARSMSSYSVLANTHHPNKSYTLPSVVLLTLCQQWIWYIFFPQCSNLDSRSIWYF